MDFSRRTLLAAPLLSPLVQGQHSTPAARTRIAVSTYSYWHFRQPKYPIEKVIEEKPESARAHFLLGVLARDSENDVVNADRHFREYIRLEPNGKHSEEARESMLKKVPQ